MQVDSNGVIKWIVHKQFFTPYIDIFSYINSARCTMNRRLGSTIFNFIYCNHIIDNSKPTRELTASNVSFRTRDPHRRPQHGKPAIVPLITRINFRAQASPAFSRTPYTATSHCPSSPSPQVPTANPQYPPILPPDFVIETFPTDTSSNSLSKAFAAIRSHSSFNLSKLNRHLQHQAL